MLPRNDDQSGALVTLLAMSDASKAKCKVKQNGKFEAKYLKNFMEWNHENLNTG